MVLTLDSAPMSLFPQLHHAEVETLPDQNTHQLILALYGFVAKSPDDRISLSTAVHGAYAHSAKCPGMNKELSLCVTSMDSH
jgi:hypothetical protein